ncbi:DUF4349 domain-containing protein [Salirhabdus salicampi]|uniref:DUF4349 domain-containing protein n=1 Tax=Salirhabdus salicampi TaxID=476102 RepID=UPI0020C45F05|nr:DUF4349 domain-containing protein [Salirhabdus salicampi]MCP8616156.1 DUF4349 domain-containing protein [Salirhabdus salicampi]
MRIYVIILAGIFLIGCQETDPTDQVGESSYDAPEQQTHKKENANWENGQNNVIHEERKVMYHGNVTMSVHNVEQSMKTITSYAKDYDGYITESSRMTTDQQLYANIRVKIPNNHLQSFLHELDGISKDIVRQQIRGQDVTEEYFDLSSRLKAKRTVEERLLTFMKEADKTEDLLSISRELAHVQEEIEQLEGRKRLLENQIDFAELFIELKESSTSLEVSQENLKTPQKIKNAFIQSINVIAKILSLFVIVVIGFSPILLCLATVIFLCWIGYKRKTHQRRKKDS